MIRFVEIFAILINSPPLLREVDAPCKKQRRVYSRVTKAFLSTPCIMYEKNWNRSIWASPDPAFESDIRSILELSELKGFEFCTFPLLVMLKY